MINFEAVEERSGNDNFFTSIYERDSDGLLIARCNQNGAHPWQVQEILNGLNGKKASADLLTAQGTLIRELMAVLNEIEQGRCARINRHGYGDCGAEGIVARVIEKAKAAGYEP